MKLTKFMNAKELDLYLRHFNLGYRCGMLLADDKKNPLESLVKELVSQSKLSLKSKAFGDGMNKAELDKDLILNRLKEQNKAQAWAKMMKEGDKEQDLER